MLGLWQNRIEKILAAWVLKLGVSIYRTREVVDFTQDEAGISVATSTGPSLRAQYLVGCDGGCSLIRKSAGIDFPGWDATTSWLTAEAATTEEPTYGFKKGAAIGKAESGARMVLMEKHLRVEVEPTLRDVSEALVDVFGTHFGIHSPTWISRFTDVTREAASYRKGRVLLADDAALVRPPWEGRGSNIGVQDAEVFSRDGPSSS